MVELIEDPIDVAALTAAVASEADGAITTFVGVVRNHAEGRQVFRLEYHAYKAMALKVLQQIGEETESRWPVRLALSHRLGRLEIGEASVAVVAASPHRAEAFEACRHAIERIKADVPIWKKEHYEEEAAWVGA